ncbi:MAG: hypothetical protein FJX02_04295 [Alphaproteobacteria bacterium]|nr:hypothetical protein [Alphaproteobacteria bacterium]
MREPPPVAIVQDWRQLETALRAARDTGAPARLATGPDAASIWGAGYLGALEARARREFPDVVFELIVDCGDAPGYALACLRAGVSRISFSGSPEVRAKLADIAHQMGAAVVESAT